MPLFQLINLLIKDPMQFLTVVIMLIIPLLISITFHECAHGFVAYKFGDPTPKMYGRLTLNPFAHLDPLGTLMLFIIGIGWAKPVPINALNIPNRTKQMLVALAGPATNFLLAVFFTIILVLFNVFYKGPINDIVNVLVASINIVIKINLILGIFNMVPFPPLDGSKVFSWILPEKIAYDYLSLEPFGIAFVLIFLFSGGFKYLIIAADFIQSKLFDGITFLINNLV